LPISDIGLGQVVPQVLDELEDLCLQLVQPVPGAGDLVQEHQCPTHGHQDHPTDAAAEEVRELHGHVRLPLQAIPPQEEEEKADEGDGYPHQHPPPLGQASPSH
jgi:hypothetical protein